MIGVFFGARSARYVAKIISLRRLVAMISLALLSSACDQGNLRGKFKPSEDDQTYLIIADDNGGNCRSVRIDRKPWLHRIGEPGRIAPGHHTVSCNGGDIGFDIPPGVVYQFDYWGP